MADQELGGVSRRLISAVIAALLAATGVVAVQAADAHPDGGAVARADCSVEWDPSCELGGGGDPGPGEPGPGPEPTVETESETYPDCNKLYDGSQWGEENGYRFNDCLEAHPDCLDEDPGGNGVGEQDPGGGTGYTNDEFRVTWSRSRPLPDGEWSEWDWSSTCDNQEPPPTPWEVRAKFITELPKGEPKFQPKVKTLTKLNTVFVTGLAENPVPRTYTIRGYTVQVRGWATNFRWNWGEPESEPFDTNRQGHPYPEAGWKDVTHKYDKVGTWNADVDVTFNGTFTANGGAPQALPPMVIADGPSVPVTVVESLPRLTY